MFFVILVYAPQLLTAPVETLAARRNFYSEYPPVIPKTPQPHPNPIATPQIHQRLP